MSDDSTLQLTEEQQNERRAGVFKMMQKTPFIGETMGITIEEWTPDEAHLRLKFDPRLTNDGKVYHGGVVASLVDTAGASAAWSGHDFTKGLKASTISMSVNYLAAAKESDLIAHAKTVRRGKELIFTEIEVTDADGKPVASGILTYRIA